MTAFGRLAFRVEGAFWNAYSAPQQRSMADAVLLGSIRMNAVEHSKARKHAFMALMQAVFAGAVKDVTGNAVSFDAPKPGPEHERAGRS